MASLITAPNKTMTAAEIYTRLPQDRLRISLFGSTKFWGKDSPALCAEIGNGLAKRLGTKVVLLTGANGVMHEKISRPFHQKVPDGVFHLAPQGYSCDFDFGQVLIAGKDMEARRSILAECAQVAIACEGGDGTADEMRKAQSFGRTLLPVARTGGASKNIFGNVTPPSNVSAETWALLADETASISASADAVVDIVTILMQQQEAAPLTEIVLLVVAPFTAEQRYVSASSVMSALWSVRPTTTTTTTKTTKTNSQMFIIQSFVEIISY